MAGNYPDYPDNRIAYHLDGTQLHYTNNDLGGVLYPVSAPTVAALADESNTRVHDQDRNEVHRLYFLFPEKRDITGYFYQTVSVGDVVDVFQVKTSVDTTNGIDGTWVTTGATALTVGGTNTSYRTDIVTLPSGLGILGLQFYLDTDFYDAAHLGTIHIFGKTTAGENPNRLEIWHPTLDQRVGASHFDWGNARRSTADTRTFRVKNLSATLTANSVTVSLLNSSDSSPSFTTAHDLAAGAGYASTQSAGNLAPGAISSVLTLRRTMASDQQLNVWATTLRAQASSWT